MWKVSGGSRETADCIISEEWDRGSWVGFYFSLNIKSFCRL